MIGIRELRRALMSGTVAATSLVAPLASAQTIPSIPGPPIFSSVDDHGVNVADGSFRPQQTLAGIGPSNARLQHIYKGTFLESNVSGGINTAPGSICGGGGCAAATMYKVSIDGTSYVFAKPTMGNPSGIITTAYFNSRGQSLSYNSTTQAYTHIDRDGNKNIFSKGLGSAGWAANEAVITSRQFKNGEVWTYSYVNCGTGCNQLSSIKSSRGYMLKYDYTGSPIPVSYFTSVTALNVSVDYCSATAPCSYTKNWPKSSISYVGTLITGMNVTDEQGRVTQYAFTNGAVSSITSPQGVQKVISYNSAAKVSSVQADGVTWTYSYGSNYTRVYGPDGLYTEYTVNSSTGDISAIRDRSGNTAYKQVDAYGFTSTYTRPEGNSQQYTRDGQANVTEYKEVAKAGSGLANVVVTETFPTCAVGVVCNKPSTHTDPKGQVTDLAYHVPSGALATVTLPAASSGAPRPQLRMSYDQVATYEKNSAGTLVQAGTIWMPTGTSTCNTSSSCVGSSDETRTIISYSGSNNALPTSFTEQSGDGAIVRTRATSYNDLGNAVYVDGFLPGAADTTVYKHSDSGELLGIIGPDPDGAGPKPHRAQRFSYNFDGQIATREAGTASGQDASGWAAFAPSSTLTTSYDAAGRRVKESLSSAGGIYSLQQFSYDSLGRLECQASRMNPVLFASPPADACVPGAAGSGVNAFGPDRITRTSFDAAGRLTTLQEAYATLDQSDETTLTYTANGRTATITDGEGNKTTYVYDGFDRLSATRFPLTTLGAGTSSATDYEQLTYDAASNITARRLRDGQTITYGYDNLGRVTGKATPGSAYYDWDVTYGYDLLGRLKSATGDGWAVNAFTYDALGRLTNEQNYNAGTLHAYDLADRQTRLGWSDGNYVDYDYNVAGDVTAIRENGATSGVRVLATYTYDNLGRRAGIVRGNGTTTSYSYDPVSRLASVSQDLSEASYDFTHSLTWNPGGQVATLTRSNDVYAWNGHYNVDRPYTVNGLNQTVAAGPTGLGYDARGNLTSSAGSGYGYTVENRMASAPGLNFIYEPKGDQLLQLYNAGTGLDTRFTWSGDQMTSEINAATLSVMRRYVPGPNTDEPVVWYEGAGMEDRRWLHADERGSVVAVTDMSGAALGINRYDEYGIPAATNIGRFQYTGQAWISELGMYYYKARMYSPSLGRFLQTDPIGYRDGINWYNYVGGDPINKVDPTGLEELPPPIRVVGNAYTVCSGYSCAFAVHELLAQVVPREDWGIITPGGTAVHFDKSDKKRCRDAKPSPKFMSDTTNVALHSVAGGGRATALSSEFSLVTRLPDFNSGGWQSVSNSHAAQSYEHALAGSDKVVKVYINDSNFGGSNTVTITSPTGSLEHYVDYIPYRAGVPVNTGNANDFWRDRLGC